MRKDLYPLIIVAVVIFMAAVLSLWSALTGNETTPTDEVVQEEYEIVIYEGDSLKFEYPSKYTRGPQGLWLNDRYYYYLNPRIDTPSDLAPDINVFTTSHGGSIDEYLKLLYGAEEEVICQDITLGQKEYCRWDNIFNEYSVVNYVADYNGLLVVFRSFFADQDQQELQDMISSLEILP